MRRLVLVCLIHVAVGALAQESRIELHTHQSAILNTAKSFNIFLPEGYDSDSLRHPVVYLFRGHEREWANPTEDGTRRGNIKTVADRLSASGTIGKMILVMPGLSQPGTDADFAYVADELIPYVDSHFRTIPVRQKRGMDGFSYGGYDMLQLLRKSPELFFTAGAYDGSFWVVDLNTFFSTATEAYWNLLRPMKFLIHSTIAGNYASNLQFLAILASHGIQNSFDTLQLAPGSAHNWYYADMHMERSLPLHWRALSRGSEHLTVQLTSPLPGAVLTGTVPVRWSVRPPVSAAGTVVEYSRDWGETWAELYSTTTADTSFLWNTAQFQDGTRYMLRVRVMGDTSYGFVQMAGRCTINNPGNALPEVVLLQPQAALNYTGEQAVTWWAEDADGDSLTIAIDASVDDGAVWNRLADSPNSGMYLWNTAASPNSSAYRLRIRARDALSTAEAISVTFAVANERPALSSSLVEHSAGSADGRVHVHVVDSSRISGHRYRIVFNDSVAAAKTYSVIDRTLGVTVLQQAPVSAIPYEGPAFDGLRLVLEDMDPPKISPDSSRWIVGASTLRPTVALPSFDPGTGLITGVPVAADYAIRLYDHIVDTSSGLFEWPVVPMKFTVWNLTESRQVDVLFTDLNGDHTIGQYDDLILVDRDSAEHAVVTWELFFQGSANPVPPSAGDVFYLKVLKPFTRRDVYEFLALPSGVVSVSPAVVPSAFRLEQNYPNPFNAATVIRYTLPPAFTDRNAGGLESAPAVDVRLVVYDILGREVAVLVDERQKPGTYAVTWTARGMASGLYFYRLQIRPLDSAAGWDSESGAGGATQTHCAVLVK